MLVFEKIEDIKYWISDCRKKGQKIGFVATMGALHRGHTSLIEQSKSENEITVCSIFVNPTQFNDKKDLERYPRPLEKDKKMLVEAGCNALFLPSVDEMYPSTDLRKFDFGTLDKTMEGAHRPGHFNGVAQIVSKLFSVVEPDKAYFGQKDFQQQAIIRNLVKQLNLNIEIITCNIVREENGLALSSRNKLLSSNEEKKASFIYKELIKVKELCKTIDLSDLRRIIHKDFESNGFLNLEYIEIVDSKSLKPLKTISESDQPIACIAAKINNVRLIDNILL